MPLVYTEIILKNTYDLMAFQRGFIEENEIREITVKAIVDPDVWSLIINEEIRDKLGLNLVGAELGTLTNGEKAMYNLAGPLEIKWKDRRTTCEAFVLPDVENVLLGAIPLQAMDLTISPAGELIGIHGDQVVHSVKA